MLSLFCSLCCFGWAFKIKIYPHWFAIETTQNSNARLVLIVSVCLVFFFFWYYFSSSIWFFVSFFLCRKCHFVRVKRGFVVLDFQRKIKFIRSIRRPRNGIKCEQKKKNRIVVVFCVEVIINRSICNDDYISVVKWNSDNFLLISIHQIDISFAMIWSSKFPSTSAICTSQQLLVVCLFLCACVCMSVIFAIFFEYCLHHSRHGSSVIK